MMMSCRTQGGALTVSIGCAEAPAMTRKLDALLDVRDRNVARAADYDMQVLILLFTVAAIWGVVRAVGFESGRLFEVLLAFAGLFISAGWLIQRHLMRAANEEYAGAIRAAADSAEPGDQESVRDRLALRPAGAGLWLGQVLSIVVFALLCGLAVGTYERDGAYDVAAFSQEAYYDGPVFYRPSRRARGGRGVAAGRRSVHGVWRMRRRGGVSVRSEFRLLRQVRGDEALGEGVSLQWAWRRLSGAPETLRRQLTPSRAGPIAGPIACLACKPVTPS